MNQCLKIDPQYSWAYNFIGMSYNRLKEYDKAIKADPKNYYALDDLGIYYRQVKNNPEKAIEKANIELRGLQSGNPVWNKLRYETEHLAYKTEEELLYQLRGLVGR